MNLTSLGIDSRTDGVLLVNHAKDEGNYALSQVNTANGTWNVFVHDNSTDGSNYEQDPLAFVFIPRTNPSLISGRFLGNGTPRHLQRGHAAVHRDQPRHGPMGTRPSRDTRPPMAS